MTAFQSTFLWFASLVGFFSFFSYQTLTIDMLSRLLYEPPENYTLFDSTTKEKSWMCPTCASIWITYHFCTDLPTQKFNIFTGFHPHLLVCLIVRPVQIVSIYLSPIWNANRHWRLTHNVSFRFVWINTDHDQFDSTTVSNAFEKSTKTTGWLNYTRNALNYALTSEVVQ